MVSWAREHETGMKQELETKRTFFKMSARIYQHTKRHILTDCTLRRDPARTNKEDVE
jgi:hypothetical protein